MARHESEIDLPINLFTTSGNELNSTILSSVSRLDNKLFCGAPWHEGEFCVDCGAMKFLNEDQKDSEAEICKECGVTEVSVQLRSLKIGRELSEENSLIAIALNNKQEVVGYGWGFVFNDVGKFVTLKYSSEDMQQRALAAMAEFGITDRFYYFSGMGIDFEYRGKGISNQLGKSVDDYARSLQLPGVTRTLFDSPIVKMREKLGFKIILGPNMPISDTENPNRVLMGRH